MPLDTLGWWQPITVPQPVSIVAAERDLLQIVEINNSRYSRFREDHDLLVRVIIRLNLGQLTQVLANWRNFKRRLTKHVRVLCESAGASVCAIKSLVCKLA